MKNLTEKIKKLLKKNEAFRDPDIHQGDSKACRDADQARGNRKNTCHAELVSASLKAGRGPEINSGRQHGSGRQEKARSAASRDFAYLKKNMATKENISSIATSTAYALGTKIAASIQGDFNA